jgi:hypothetical protein
MAGLEVAGIISAAGSLISGIASFQAAQAQAAIYEMNAEIAMDNSRRAIERSQVEQQEQDIMTRAMLGEQLAAQSASGVSVGFGSPVKTRVAARELGRKDALNVRQAGELESYNYKSDAATSSAMAAAKRSEAGFNLLSGFLNAGSVITQSRNKNRFNSSYFAPVPVPRPTSLMA